MIKKIKIPLNVVLKFVIIENKKYLMGQSIKVPFSYYIPIPNYIKINKLDSFLSIEVFSLENKIENLNSFFNVLNDFLKKLEKHYKKTILLKGLGLKANLNKDNSILELKLGYSHICKINIPKSILNINLIKNNIIVEGIDYIEIGNFLNKIRALKIPNIYKGKGIWYKNEIKILKIIKKT
jgi:ribosomal protein L6P/L9E